MAQYKRSDLLFGYAWTSAEAHDNPNNSGNADALRLNRQEGWEVPGCESCDRPDGTVLYIEARARIARAERMAKNASRLVRVPVELIDCRAELAARLCQGLATFARHH